MEKDTRIDIRKDCIFVLVCEKSKVGRQLAEGLRQKGFTLNLVLTRGHSPNDVKGIALNIVLVKQKNEKNPATM